MKRILLLLLLQLCALPALCWGFYGHRQINYHAVFLLPPEMLLLYKVHIEWLSNHSTDPDMRRYAVKEEAPKHFIDIDHYGTYPYSDLPRNWKSAVNKFSEDSLLAHGIVPWQVERMLFRLTSAFKCKDLMLILKYSAEIGHYIGDAHVPLHASSNHNGQLTGQKGIHAFWESRVPELLGPKGYNFLIGKAAYIAAPLTYIWERVLESAAAADTVLSVEKSLSLETDDDLKYGFEERNGKLIRQYSAYFTQKYDQALQGMAERRMRLAIFSVASFWYTAWVNAGQPDLRSLADRKLSESEQKSFDTLIINRNDHPMMIGRAEE